MSIVVPRRVLVSPSLPRLRTRNPEIDAWAEALNRFVAETFSQLRWLVGSATDFTPVIQGSGTAGTYELDSAKAFSVRMGDMVHVAFSVTLAGAITGGGTGNLNITGLPIVKREDAPAVGAVWMHTVNWTAGASLSLSFPSLAESSTLAVFETNDDGALSSVPVSGLAAGDIISGSIAYLAKE
jgi:hypothetical protein